MPSENMELAIHQGYSSELHLSFSFLSQSAIHSDQAPSVTLSIARQCQELSSRSSVPLALRPVVLQIPQKLLAIQGLFVLSAFNTNLLVNPHQICLSCPLSSVHMAINYHFLLP